MKKKLFTIGAMCFICFATINANGQDKREKVDFGFKAGINLSNVWDSEGQEFKADSKIGFAGGVYMGIPIGKIIGIQPEVLISQKGFKGSGSLLGFPYSTSRTTTYIDIPLQLQIKPSEFIHIVIGPQFSYLLNQKDKYTFGSNSQEQEKEFENDNIRKNILGFVAGLDILYENLVVSGRVGRDLQNNNGDGSSTTPRYKNQWLQFTLGVKI